MAAKAATGYNVQVIHESDKERFKCALCLDIIKSATHGCTSHVFCKECMLGYIEINRSKDKLFCPAGCGKPFNREKLQFSEVIDHFVNTIACKCPDCSWQGDLYDFVQQHELNCLEKKVTCHLCNEFIKRKELESHVSDLCQNRKMECQYCSKEMPYCEHGMHEDVCQSSKVECYYKKFGCTEMIKRKSMELHNEKRNCKHLFLVTKYFEDKNESLQLANKDLILINRKLETDNTMLKKSFNDLDENMKATLQKLKKESIYLKSQILALKFSVFEKFFKNVEFQDNEILIFKKCSLTLDLLAKYFDTTDYASIAENLIDECQELEEYKDELVELIERSAIVRFDKEFHFYIFFKIESFTVYQFYKSGEPLLRKINEKYFYSKTSRFYLLLYLSKWEIDLTNAPVDVSKPDKRFVLSPQPFISNVYGCLCCFDHKLFMNKLF